jgi:hypothetical protein
MGLNNIGEWLEQLERRKQLQQEVMDGEFIELRKADGFAYPRIIGTVDDFLKKRTDAEFKRLLEKTKKNSLDIEVAKSIAIAKTLPLKKTPKIEVAKQNHVEKPLVLELPKIALHGRNVVLDELMTWRVLRGMMAWRIDMWERL